jgi:lambda repressor-like predicted transcriptional regulator
VSNSRFSCVGCSGQRCKRGPIMRKQRTLKKSKKRNASGRSNLKSYRAPRTAKELFARPRKLQQQWNRIVQVPSEMRSQGLTLRQASRRFGVSPNTVLRLASSAFRKKNGKYMAKTTDRLLRVLLVPSKKGLREVAIRDSRQASLIGEYWSAVEKFLVRGDASFLRKLRRRSVTDASGKRIRLLFELEELKRQGSGDVLRFESIYGRNV